MARMLRHRACVLSWWFVVASVLHFQVAPLCARQLLQREYQYQAGNQAGDGAPFASDDATFREVFWPLFAHSRSAGSTGVSRVARLAELAASVVAEAVLEAAREVRGSVPEDSVNAATQLESAVRAAKRRSEDEQEDGGEADEEAEALGHTALSHDRALSDVLKELRQRVEGTQPGNFGVWVRWANLLMANAPHQQQQQPHQQHLQHRNSALSSSR